ncbi:MULTISPECIES: hypothetical protein [Vibrionaceae]|uniref:hypothetical protein n=1 Tax=Vibrionaceae TaxID=641 RepID=UPI00018F40E1|nr:MULTISPECIES: hypothetical protein [Vibrionaceae]EED25091.1 hypothetical protein VPMS16_1052 [Vibrio sp. 16]MBV7298928.1 hypothetical protein [Enterovibrio paralichthyis]CAK4070801.1 hypothetical protein VDT1_2670 [Vibrio sp. 16]
MAEYQTLIIAAVSAISSGIGVGVAIKTDLKWIRRTMEKMEERIVRLEERH